MPVGRAAAANAFSRSAAVHFATATATASRVPSHPSTFRAPAWWCGRFEWIWIQRPSPAR